MMIMVKIAMMMVKIAVMMVKTAVMMVKIAVMLLEKETALDGYLVNSWAEKSRGPCSGKCAPGIQNVTYQVVRKNENENCSKSENNFQCVKKLASQKGVVVGGKYCQLELGKKPEPGNC